MAERKQPQRQAVSDRNPRHPWFIAVQFLSEFKSKLNRCILFYGLSRQLSNDATRM